LKKNIEQNEDQGFIQKMQAYLVSLLDKNTKNLPPNSQDGDDTEEDVAMKLSELNEDNDQKISPIQNFKISLNKKNITL
jgi:hypothetical protein